MLQFLKTAANCARTENGAPAYRSTLSHCLDLFSVAGGLRQAEPERIEVLFARAYAENPDLAVRIAFFLRDVRGGMGERRLFRVMLRWLCWNAPETVIYHLSHVAYYGRYDDLLELMGTPCEPAAAGLIKDQLQKDLEAANTGGKVSLLAKWLPSVNASNRRTVENARRLAKAVGMREREYRRTLSFLRRKIGILENCLRERDYTFDYAKQPSRAMFCYRRAFLRRDAQRYRAFMEAVRKGEAALHTGTLYPYELVRACLERPLSAQERQTLDAAWRALPDFGGERNALVVVDGSGSMYSHPWGRNSRNAPLPASVALSLGLYFAQRNTGPFAGHFITFSRTPQLVEVKGRDLYEQVNYCRSFQEAANTDLAAVFELILKTAVTYRLAQSQLPETLYIVSDMEFDSCAENAGAHHFTHARMKFAKEGYRLSKVVFWNVANRREQQPVLRNEQGAALISGCAPRLFEQVASGNFSPQAYMLEILDSERYAGIAACPDVEARNERIF